MHLDIEFRVNVRPLRRELDELCLAVGRSEFGTDYPALLDGYAVTTSAWTTAGPLDRKSTRLNSSHRCISYAVFCLKKKTIQKQDMRTGIPLTGLTAHYCIVKHDYCISLRHHVDCRTFPFISASGIYDHL